jgi:hypothetical protein
MGQMVLKVEQLYRHAAVHLAQDEAVVALILLVELHKLAVNRKAAALDKTGKITDIFSESELCKPNSKNTPRNTEQGAAHTFARALPRHHRGT